MLIYQCMWWIIGSIIVAILFLGLIALIIVLSNNIKNHHGGGTHSSRGSLSWFAPAKERAGKLGEFKANLHLKSLLKSDEYLLTNLLIPLKNGYKTEIDCVLISRKGIFCIETKRWVGHISGNDNDEYWYQSYDDPSKADKQHRNPVLQNEQHKEILEKLINNDCPVDNVVIFVELEDGWAIESRFAYTLGSFANYYYGLNDDELSVEELAPIYETLCIYEASPQELAKHREETRRRFN